MLDQCRGRLQQVTTPSRAPRRHTAEVMHTRSHTAQRSTPLHTGLCGLLHTGLRQPVSPMSGPRPAAPSRLAPPRPCRCLSPSPSVRCVRARHEGAGTRHRRPSAFHQGPLARATQPPRPLPRPRLSRPAGARPSRARNLPSRAGPCSCRPHGPVAPARAPATRPAPQPRPRLAVPSHLRSPAEGAAWGAQA